MLPSSSDPVHVQVQEFFPNASLDEDEEVSLDNPTLQALMVAHDITPVDGGVTANLTQIRRHWANLYPEAQETPLDEDAEAESNDEAEDN